MSEGLLRELEAKKAIRRPEAPAPKPDPVLAEIRNQQQAAELRAAATLDSLRQIRDLLARKTEMKFDLVRDDDTGDLKSVIARPI